MKIRYLSLTRLARVPPASNTAAIVIWNPGVQRIPFGFQRILHLEFQDITRLSGLDAWIAWLFGAKPRKCIEMRRMLKGSSPSRWRPPLKGDAIAILEFVDSLSPKTMELFVACEQGKGRSRAVAEFAAARLFCTFEEGENSQSNPILRRLLVDVAASAPND